MIPSNINVERYHFHGSVGMGGFIVEGQVYLVCHKSTVDRRIKMCRVEHDICSDLKYRDHSHEYLPDEFNKEEKERIIEAMESGVMDDPFVSEPGCHLKRICVWVLKEKVK